MAKVTVVPDDEAEALLAPYGGVIVHRRAATHADSPEEAVRTAREAGEPPNGALVRHPPAERRAWLP